MEQTLNKESYQDQSICLCLKIGIKLCESKTGSRCIHSAVGGQNSHLLEIDPGGELLRKRQSENPLP